MTYEETLQFLYAKLPMYQRIGPAAFKKDLTNIIKLTSALGNRYRQFPTIHIAGTNGKGSVAHMLASILQESGYKTGLYTSPHLKDFRERIKINGEMVSRDFVIDFTRTIKDLIEEIQPSFFEITVAMAFEAFADEGVDVAIIETGLGGRLDSTNIITPVLSVITNIGFDHTDMLGDTLEQIAGEKAGIIKPGVPVVIGESLEETRPVFQQKADACNSRIVYSEEQQHDLSAVSDLQGRFQTINQRTVLTSVAELRNLGWNISDENIKSGLSGVIRNTGLRGRWEKLRSDPTVYCDTAHNQEGMAKVTENIAAMHYNRLHVVFGAAEGKKVDGLIRLFPEALFYLCKPDVPRGLPVAQLIPFFESAGRAWKQFSSPAEAYDEALRLAGKEDLIFVGGSTFVVADVLNYLES